MGWRDTSEQKSDQHPSNEKYWKSPQPPSHLHLSTTENTLLSTTVFICVADTNVKCNQSSLYAVLLNYTKCGLKSKVFISLPSYSTICLLTQLPSNPGSLGRCSYRLKPGQSRRATWTQRRNKLSFLIFNLHIYVTPLQKLVTGISDLYNTRLIWIKWSSTGYETRGR